MSINKQCHIILKEDVLSILNNIFENLNSNDTASDILSLVIHKVDNIKQYDLKELYEDANPIVDNLLVTSVDKGRLKKRGQGYQEAKIRLSYTPAFPAMQRYFIKWVEWINKKGSQLRKKKEKYESQI